MITILFLKKILLLNNTIFFIDKFIDKKWRNYFIIICDINCEYTFNETIFDVKYNYHLDIEVA